MKIVCDEEINLEQWELLINNNPLSSPFQSPVYYNIFNSVKGIAANVFGVENNHKLESLVVVTIHKEKGLKGYFSRRGIIYGGPVLGTVESATHLLDFISEKYRDKLIYLETRNFFDYSPYNTVFNKTGWHYIRWLNFQLPIISEFQVKKNMSSSRLRQIKKAKRSGASWNEARSLDEVKSFYDILFNLYRDKIKKPLLPWEFFKEHYNSNAGKFLLVYYKNKVVGGIMAPFLPGKTIYEFYVCGLDMEYKDQYPSVMATWAAIDYALNNSIKVFDFMGAGNPSEDYGVRQFKARFGGEEVENGRFIKIFNPYLYNLGKLGLKILSKIN